MKFSLLPNLVKPSLVHGKEVGILNHKVSQLPKVAIQQFPNYFFWPSAHHLPNVNTIQRSNLKLAFDALSYWIFLSCFNSFPLFDSSRFESRSEVEALPWLKRGHLLKSPCRDIGTLAMQIIGWISCFNPSTTCHRCSIWSWRWLEEEGFQILLPLEFRVTFK